MDSSAKNIANIGANNTVCVEEKRKRKYTKDELFKLAKSMKDNELLVEELGRFENADWTRYKLDLIDYSEDSTESKVRPSLSYFSRQKSEMNHDYSSLNDPRFTGGRFGPNNHKHRLSRMTSSPSIKYKNSQAFDSSQFTDGISSQVRAKYARLIETFSTNSSAQQESLEGATYRSSKSSVSRTNSHNSWLANERHHHVERPTNIFGPIRRENSAFSDRRSERRNSEEPTSLPYSATSSNSGKWLPSSNTSRLLIDDLSDFSSPIKRISASDKPIGLDKNKQTGESNEEDDFDITSLLSITVLSDIKTIRQDLSGTVASRQPMSLGSAKLSSKQISRHNSNQDHPPPPLPVTRPLSRARTATDFTHSGRQSFNDTSNHHHHHQRMLNQDSYLNDYRSGSSEYLQNQYTWQPQQQQQQHNFYNNQPMARGSLTNLSSKQQDNKKPVDESVAHIIETFKAQVKARAEANAAAILPSLSSSATGDSTKSTSSNQYIKDFKAPDLKTKSSVNAVASKATRAEDSNHAKAPEGSKDLIKTNSAADKNDNTASELVDDKAKLAESTICDNEKTVKESKEKQSGSTSDKKQQNTGQYSTSNIPRLISLHIQRSSPLFSKTNEEESKSQLLKGQSDEVSPSSSTNKLASTKFVSQYKRLRGKSLADEVEELTK